MPYFNFLLSCFDEFEVIDTEYFESTNQKSYRMARYFPSANSSALFCVPRIFSEFECQESNHIPHEDGMHLIYFKIGDGIAIANGEEFLVHDGYLMLMADQEYCDMKFNGILYWIVFQGEPARNLCQQLNKRFGYVYRLAKDDPIPYILKALMVEMHRPSPREGLLCCMLAEVLCALYDHSIRTSSENDADGSVKRAILFIRDHFNEKIKASDVAREVSMSPVYFNRIFKNSTGLTVRDYIRKVRLETAQVILHYTDKSVRQIATELGFASDADFVKRFKKYSGMTPSDFRAHEAP